SRRGLDAWEQMCEIGQRGMTAVAVRQNRLAYGPWDGERGIVPGDADLAVRIVEVRALVLDLRDRRRDAEAVGEPGRDVALLEVPGREHHGHPAAVGRRSAAHVDCDVVDRAFDDANQLSLRPPQLKVQPADRAADRSRVVVLDERAGDPARAVLVR